MDEVKACSLSDPVARYSQNLGQKPEHYQKNLPPGKKGFYSFLKDVHKHQYILIPSIRKVHLSEVYFPFLTRIVHSSS